MQKLYSKRYYIAFWFSLIIFFITIVLLHSSYNLQNILKAPSDIWGRSTSLAAMDLFNKQPAVRLNERYADILTANKSDFTHISIDRTTRKVASRTISIAGVESYKVQEFEWDKDNIYFIESGSLYFAAQNLNGSYPAKTLIDKEVLGFELINTEKGSIIAAAEKNGIKLFKQNNSAFEQYGAGIELEKIKGLSIVEDQKGIFHIAAYAEISDIEYQIYYFTLGNGQLHLEASAIEKILSESWSINSIQIGVDDADAYIFYNMTKRDKFGVGAKVQYTSVPLQTDNTEMKFNRLYLSKEDAVNQGSYLNEARVVKTQDNTVKLTAVKDTYDKKNSNGFSGYFVTMKAGLIADVTRVTRNQSYMINTVSQSYESDFAFVYLNAAGGFNYEAFYTETGKEYYLSTLKPTEEDYKVAVMDAIPGYISSLFLSLIKLTVYLPALLWFLIVEFFEIRRLKTRPRLSYAIGFTLYLIIKLISFNTYYTPVSIAQMPPLLVFAGAKYVYAISIAVVAVLIQKQLKKHKLEMNIITEGIIFILIDVVFTNLLYSTYLV